MLSTAGVSGSKQVHNDPKQGSAQQGGNRHPIEVIKQFGKKYTNLPSEKQEKIKAEIKELAKSVSYEDLQPLFSTTAKKVGTRIAAMITLGVLLENGQEKTQEAVDFITIASEDKNELLAEEAKRLA